MQPRQVCLASLVLLVSAFMNVHPRGLTVIMHPDDEAVRTAVLEREARLPYEGELGVSARIVVPQQSQLLEGRREAADRGRRMVTIPISRGSAAVPATGAARSKQL
jgi:hypothetical protein